jgi:hypothetical protein
MDKTTVDPPRATPSDRTAPRIDPRFARRWTQVRREAGRRRLRIALTAGAVLTVVALAAGSLFSPLFEVRHVRLVVIGQVPRAEVLAVTGLARPRPLIEVNTRVVAARLDAVADLGGAMVRRSWPTTVIIQVARRTPIAVVARSHPAGGPSGWATVDVTGRILANVAAPVVGLPLVQGVTDVPPPGGWLAGTAGPGAPLTAALAGRSLVDLNAAPDSPSTPTGPAAALAVVAALPPLVRTDTLTVTLGSANQLTMLVPPATIASGSIPVTFGDGSQLAQKLSALATLLTQANLSGVAGIDLTVPERPAALTAR